MNAFNRTLVILAVVSSIGSITNPAFAWDRHPRRNEVNRRDNNINRQINRDKGDLGGNYKSLKSQDRAIRRQTRADFRANGGHLTRQEKTQLNQEENGLRNEVHQDYR